MSVATTLTGGIQDVSALLPLLGTEQCEDHASSALTKGYLYAAVTPVSLFGSLGLARAGIKTFVASLNFSILSLNIHGALMLSNMGFRSQGANLPLIMVDESKKDMRHLVETRLDELLKELHVDKNKIEDVRQATTKWNSLMIAHTALFCVLSVIPYIYLNLRAGSGLSHGTRWTFPSVRAIGGFLTATMMQLIIQRRITTLSRQWLSKRDNSQTNNGSGLVAKPTSEKDTPQSVGRSEGADHHDLESGWKPTTPSDRANEVSAANTAQDHWAVTVTDRPRQERSSENGTSKANDQDRMTGRVSLNHQDIEKRPRSAGM